MPLTWLGFKIWFRFKLWWDNKQNLEEDKSNSWWNGRIIRWKSLKPKIYLSKSLDRMSWLFFDIHNSTYIHLRWKSYSKKKQSLAKYKLKLLRVWDVNAVHIHPNTIGKNFFKAMIVLFCFTTILVFYCFWIISFKSLYFNFYY